jgi:hypothetical protein
LTEVDRLLRSRFGSNLTLIAASAALPAAVMHFFVSEDKAPVTAVQHLFIMAIGSSIAALSSLALMLAGFRQRETRAVVAGGAFAAMTLILLIHGLATPGVILGQNGVVAVAGGLALPVGGAILTLAALPALRGPRHLRTVALGLTGLLALIAALGLAGFLVPQDVPNVPGYESPEAIVLLVVGTLFFLTVASRAVRTFALTRRSADLVVIVGIVWLGVALVPVLVLDPYTWVWWCGHALELLGVTLVGVPVALDVHRGRPSHPLVGDLPAAELVAEEEAFLGARVRVLMARLEAKDVSTEEHTRRVAEWAVQIGEQLGLAPGRLRDLALAGLLHDIGKLSTPDAILTKPGRLTDAEMDVIKRHPVHGDDLAASSATPSGSAAASAATTSASTAAATPTACAATRSTWRPASSPSPTSGTRSSRPASTAGPGRPSARWACSSTRPAAASTSAASARCAPSRAWSPKRAPRRRSPPDVCTVAIRGTRDKCPVNDRRVPRLVGGPRSEASWPPNSSARSSSSCSARARWRWRCRRSTNQDAARRSSRPAAIGCSSAGAGAWRSPSASTSPVGSPARI